MALCVQFGCGFHAPAGWLNFDASPTQRYEKLPILGRLYTKNIARFPEVVRYGDIVRGLPVAAGSVDKLYASHVLEHLSYDDARRALKNCHASLKPGGIFRLIVPDLHVRAQIYLSDDSATAAAKFLDSAMLGERKRPKSFLEILSELFGGSAHRWMWDEQSIAQDLREAGFTAIRRCDFGDSGDPDFAQVEIASRFQDGDIRELAMECRKPVSG